MGRFPTILSACKPKHVAVLEDAMLQVTLDLQFAIALPNAAVSNAAEQQTEANYLGNGAGIAYLGCTSRRILPRPSHLDHSLAAYLLRPRSRQPQTDPPDECLILPISEQQHPWKSRDRRGF